MKIKFYLLFTLYIVLSNCKNVNEQNCIEYYDAKYTNSRSSSTSLYDTLTLAPVVLDTTIECSNVGDFTIYDNRLFFSDMYFNYVYEFNNLFKAINKFAGQGHGPNEVPDFTYFIPLEKNFILLSIGNSMMYRFDYEGIRQGQTRLEWKGTRKEALRLYNDPKPNDYRCYEPDFGIDDVVRKWDKEHIAYGITASWPKFNGYFNSDLYYEHSRILAIADISSGEITKIIGRRSPLYLKHKNIPNFDHFCFEITNKNIFLSFRPDEKIYIIDKETDKVLSSFGSAGKNMNTDYKLTNDYNQAEMHRVSDLEKYGYYKYLSIDLKTGLLFRGYTKGNHEKTEGLQIYKLDNKQLIADLDVPVGFKVVGRFNNKLYGQIEEPMENDKLIIYEIIFR